MSAQFTFGQSANDWREQLGITHNGTIGTLHWQSREGRVYFFLTSEDLMSWEYYPAISSGIVGFTEWDFLVDADSDKGFFKLRYTDRFMFDPNSEDLDGDGVSNMDEISQVPPTDPFSATDADGNGLFDDWESFHSITSATGDEEPDTLTNQTESLIGSNPNRAFVVTTSLEVFTPN